MADGGGDGNAASLCPTPQREAVAPVKLVIFNVKYSPNLGDGLLSECLEMELRATPGRPEVRSADLAGRTAYSAGSGQRERALALLGRLPGGVRQIAADAALAVLVGMRLRPAWRRMLADADGVIVGGGNLFADVDLNFPRKIAGALGAAAERKLPVAVHAVGATDNWTNKGRHLFASALSRSRLVAATVRDERSRHVWNAALPPRGVMPAAIAPDPGLLTARHFPARPRDDATPHAALGIMSPLAIRYHANDRAAGAALEDWYAAAAAGLAARGYRVSLFTNGSPEDRSYLAAHGDRLRAGARDRIRVEPGFADPAGLAGFLSGCDVVLGHRMHAIIAAYSYGIPAIGFAWDVKLRSFFELIGHPDRLIDPDAIAPDTAAARGQAAAAEGIDRTLHDRLIGECRDGIARLAARLCEAARAGAGG